MVMQMHGDGDGVCELESESELEREFGEWREIRWALSCIKGSCVGLSLSLARADESEQQQ